MILLREGRHMNDTMQMLVIVKIECHQYIGIILGRKQSIESQVLILRDERFLFLEFRARWTQPFFGDFSDERDNLCDLQHEREWYASKQSPRLAATSVKNLKRECLA